MTVSATVLDEIERAVARGWPATETEVIDGWLARAASGGSVRANTVAALDYHGTDLDRSLARVVAFYRARGATPRFTVAAASQPAGLDVALERRGWKQHGAHVTMTMPVRAIPREAPGIEHLACPEPGWIDCYLNGLSPDRRGPAPEIIARVPQPRRLFAVRRAGRIVACGLSVLDRGLASVQCMATLPDARRTGAASAILGAIETYALTASARTLYLQTDANNAAALTLYERSGFTIADRYHTRVLVG